MNTTADGDMRRDGVKRRVSGLLPPIVTPFKNGEPDLDGLAALVATLGDWVDGFLVGGSVGETPSLSLAERVEVIATVGRAKRPQHFLAVSIADNALPNSRRLIEAGTKAGADLLMLSCPNYFVNDFTMLRHYFVTIDRMVDADLCLYDNPIATGTTLSCADIQELAAACEHLTHIKVTDTSIAKFDALRRATKLALFAGEDTVLWHQLVRGVRGAMVALPLIDPVNARTLWDAVASGDLVAARRTFAAVAPFINVALGAPDYVAVIKTAMHARGLIGSADVRPPLVPLDEPRRAEIVGVVPAGALS